MLKNIIILLVLIFFPLISNAQQKLHEIGVFAGVGYYMGDLNQSKLFYSAQPAFSLVYKLDLNSRYALRFNGMFASLSGNDANSNNGYQQQRNHSFNIGITEFDALLEFNFLPYKPDSRSEFFSPFITIGLGAMIMPVEEGSIPVNPVIPFGVGLKYAFTKKLGIAAEWTYRKTFTDYIDQLPKQTFTESATFNNKQSTYTSSKDWYSFAGITLTYKFALGSSKCPAYRK